MKLHRVTLVDIYGNYTQKVSVLKIGHFSSNLSNFRVNYSQTRSRDEDFAQDRIKKE